MATVRYSKRQVATTLRLRQSEAENRRLRKLVADLPFDKFILLQEIWERPHREVQQNRGLNTNSRRV